VISAFNYLKSPCNNPFKFWRRSSLR